MGKIFKISGNFMQNGEWAQPDPSFTGEIFVDDASIFCGYCNELYASHMSEVNKTRFLAGAFAPNGKNGKTGIAFYKMSNDPIQAPLMYVMPDLDNVQSGSWAALGLFGYFEPQGKAKITIEEATYSEDDESRIKSQFEEVDKSINGNDQLLEQVQCCIDILTNAE